MLGALESLLFYSLPCVQDGVYIMRKMNRVLVKVNYQFTKKSFKFDGLPGTQVFVCFCFVLLELLSWRNAYKYLTFEDL